MLDNLYFKLSKSFQLESQYFTNERNFAAVKMIPRFSKYSIILIFT